MEVTENRYKEWTDVEMQEIFMIYLMFVHKGGWNMTPDGVIKYKNNIVIRVKSLEDLDGRTYGNVYKIKTSEDLNNFIGSIKNPENSKNPENLKIRENLKKANDGGWLLTPLKRYEEYLKYLEAEETHADGLRKEYNYHIENNTTALQYYKDNYKGNKMDYIDEIKLLKRNKQLIMNGAPGTGKTYTARNQIADLLFSNSEEESQSIEAKDKKLRIKMIQFHPSYDYTDFIEGIRPNLSKSDDSENNDTESNDSIGYEMRNGSFKSFCRQAGVLERIMSAGKEISSDTINTFLVGETDEIVEYWKNAIKNEDFEGVIKKYNATYKEEDSTDKAEAIQAVVDLVVENCSFLFIIDEINRAEISKVLGEVMFCLDPDYRGDNGKIGLQYSNTSSSDETFYINKKGDQFFIPNNVYIIGTMNDIDRSVEVFDFALRRRFAWKEIKANDVMEGVILSIFGSASDLQTATKTQKTKFLNTSLADVFLNEKWRNKSEMVGEFIERAKSLNGFPEKDSKAPTEGKPPTSIHDTLKFPDTYHLGPAYFAKLLNYKDAESYQDALKELWDNHLSQIIKEYIKVKKDEGQLGELEKSFIDYKPKSGSESKK